MVALTPAQVAKLNLSGPAPTNRQALGLGAYDPTDRHRIVRAAARLRGLSTHQQQQDDQEESTVVVEETEIDYREQRDKLVSLLDEYGMNPEDISDMNSRVTNAEKQGRDPEKPRNAQHQEKTLTTSRLSPEAVKLLRDADRGEAGRERSLSHEQEALEYDIHQKAQNGRLTPQAVKSAREANAQSQSSTFFAVRGLTNKTARNGISEVYREALFVYGVREDGQTFSFPPLYLTPNFHDESFRTARSRVEIEQTHLLEQLRQLEGMGLPEKISHDLRRQLNQEALDRQAERQHEQRSRQHDRSRRREQGRDAARFHRRPARYNSARTAGGRSR